MDLGFLIFAIVMAGAAVGLAFFCGVSEAAEGWRIARRGWTRGHGEHRMLAHRNP